ncbi:Uncharacterised protein [Vibrio cholerae]|nr:Uncharacterised protein [Vibrio cholerae]
MISSINSSSFKRGAIRPIASAACGALSESRHRIDAQPSGEITE